MTIDQVFFLLKRHIQALLGAFLILFSLSGCSEGVAEPELEDSIYTDLQERLDQTRRKLNEAKKDLKRAKKEQKEIIPQTGENKRIQTIFRLSKDAIRRYEQKVQYIKLRMEKRKIIVRYRALDDSDPASPKEEGQSYKIQRQLAEAPLNWDKRVPKLNPKPIGGPIP